MSAKLLVLHATLSTTVRPQTAAAMAKTRGQAKPKRQLKQPDKYDPGEQGKQTGGQGTQAQDHAARDAALKLKATSKQATKVKAA